MKQYKQWRDSQNPCPYCLTAMIVLQEVETGYTQSFCPDCWYSPPKVTLRNPPKLQPLRSKNELP